MTPNPQDSAVALEVELLPCPFCGAHLPEFTRCIAGSNRHRIKCTECPGRAEFFSSTEEQAVAAWNRRASQSDGTSGGWLEIASAPKDGTAVLVHQKIDNAHWIVTPAYFAGGKWQIVCFHDGNVEYEVNPTFWMPLPAAPNQGENHVR